MKPTIYIAYQGDINEYQSVRIASEQTDIQDEVISTMVDSCFRACLDAWWRDEKPAPVGFVIRMTERGWEAWSVEYVNDEWTQGTCVRISRGDDNREAPTAWPIITGATQ